MRVLARATAALIGNATAASGSAAAVVTFSPHPGTSGALERAAFRAEGVPAGAFVEVDSSPPALLAAAASASLGHYSTCGLQSLFVGTPHVYVSAPGVPAPDDLAAGLIRTADDTDGIVRLVMDTHFRFDGAARLDALVPANATERMARRLGVDVVR